MKLQLTILLSFLISISTLAQAQKKSDIDTKVENLISKMTLQEKKCNYKFAPLMHLRNF